MNGADRLCDVLLANDVDVCFANPGTSEMHFVAALDRKPQMRCILGLFEGVATGAADGYARMTGRPAATLLHTGPGLANGLANIHNARRARSPMINVVGDHASYHLPFDAPLTTDIEMLARPMSDWVRRISGPDDVGAATEAAYLAAVTRSAISTLILPADAAWGETAHTDARRIAVPPPGRVPQEDVEALAQAIRATPPGRTGFVLGGRSTRAAPLATAGRISAAWDVRLFSEVFISRIERGLGRVPIERIPYPVDPATAMLRDIDCLVLVGATPPVAFFAYPGKPSALAPGHARVLTLGMPGDDLGEALDALAEALGVPPETRARRADSAGAAPVGLPTGTLTDAALAAIIARLVPEDAIVVDEGLTSIRSFYALSAGAPPHDYLMHTGGAIGIGIPLATGAAVACPNRKVLALQADGSGMYTVQGLWTQARENLDVVTVIFANRAYAILQQEMRNVGVTHFGRNADRMLRLDQPTLDWVGLANAMGVEGASVETCEGFSSVLDYALSRHGPFLIEAVL
jgi:acetolactate synthase-1/2/3 large subunit